MYIPIIVIPIRSRKHRHLEYMYSSIHKLNKEILKSALAGEETNEIKVKLYKKYSRRLRWLQF